MRKKTLLILLVIISSCSYENSNRVTGSKKTELFLPGLVSTELFEMNASFSNSGNVFYYSIADPYQNYNAIFFIEKIDERWNKPEIISFSGNYSDFDPFLTHDENRMYFCSKRPTHANDQTDDANIWCVKKENNNWCEPKLVEFVNSEFNEYYVSVSGNNDIYFSSTRTGGEGMWDIYFLNNQDTVVHNLGEPINTSSREWDPFISEDERFIIFTSDREGGFGGGDLYISFKNKFDEWSYPQNLGDKVNTLDYEYCASISKDNEYLYFSRFGGESIDFVTKEKKTYQDFTNKLKSTENGLGNIYRIKLSELAIF